MEDGPTELSYIHCMMLYCHQERVDKNCNANHLYFLAHKCVTNDHSSVGGKSELNNIIMCHSYNNIMHAWHKRVSLIIDLP